MIIVAIIGERKGVGGVVIKKGERNKNERKEKKKIDKKDEEKRKREKKEGD